MARLGFGLGIARGDRIRNMVRLHIVNSTRTHRIVRPASDTTTINLIAPDGTRYSIKPRT